MRKLLLLLVVSFLLFSFSSIAQECTDLSVSEHWGHGRAALCKNDPHCNYCPLKYSTCRARYTSKATNRQMECNVCFDTAKLQNQQTQQLAKLKSCISVNARNTKIIVMKITEWSKCKSPNTDQQDFSTIWTELLEANYIANITSGKNHILYKIRYKFYRQSCQKKFNDCGIKEDNVDVNHLAALSDCMKCSCPWGTQNTTEIIDPARGVKTEDNHGTTDTADKPTIPENTPLLDKKTNLVLSIVIPATVAVSIVTTCVVIFCYHKCKKSQEGDIQMEEFHGELNEEYGQYYLVEGDKMIESEVEDTNEDYGETGEQEETGSTMVTDNNPEYE